MPKLPSVSGERLVRALKRAGFVELRQKGSHVSMERRAGDKLFRTVVPMHSELAKGTLSDILKQCNLQIDELIELL
ncbi:MAG: type II toxin-antitoxin system HicA family toxin [Acidobacteria bacterium]|nr:type II toxin-antitoxin system HicA family toxin [Acidobacteriota bacterium]